MVLYLGNTKVAPIENRPCILREVDSNGEFKIPSSAYNVVLHSSATKLGEYALYYAYRSSGIKSFNANNITEIEHYKNYAMNNAFYYCASLEEISFPELTTISASNSMSYMCTHCTNLTKVNFPKLAVINWEASQFSYAFYYCTSLETISFPALQQMDIGTVFNNAFNNCTSLKHVYFPALTTSSFGNVKTQFNNMLTNCSGCTVHFPSNLQSTISTWATPSNMKGTNTTVLFDLPATS